MSHLLSKSEINKEAAELMHQKGYYPSAVHCFYYSCIQYIRYIIFNIIKIDENELSNRIRSSKNEGSHEVMISIVTKHYEQYNKIDSSSFYKNIHLLKKLRTKSDYDDVLIDIGKSENSKNLCSEILRFLKK